MTLTTRIKIKQPAGIQILYALFVLALVVPNPILLASSLEEDKSPHGEIRQIDQMYDMIKAQIGTDNLIELERKFKYCEPYEDVLRAIHIDHSGTVRHYHAKGGSEDSSVKRDSYYDEEGRLRLTLIDGRAVNETQIRYHIYYDQRGRQIHESHEKVTGPGYPFATAFTTSDFVSEPLKSFHSKNPCLEITDPKTECGEFCNN
ncbi:hypothetical protein [Nitrosospira multiformis]|uniref:hypothetical protein n=1 Tax=Nitrosospira multiformis TaxID=1231 RepID=UPI000943A1E9|nr:hypothetical protein [Nitrosospira multiformis]